MSSRESLVSDAGNPRKRTLLRNIVIMLILIGVAFELVGYLTRSTVLFLSGAGLPVLGFILIVIALENHNRKMRKLLKQEASRIEREQHTRQ